MAKLQAPQTYNLALTDTIQFSIPASKLNWRNYRWWQVFYKLSNALALFLLALLLFTNLWNTFYLNTDQVASTNLYAWATILSALGLIFLWQLTVVGHKRLVDPPGFIGILSFALLSILVWIIAPEVGAPGASRTFNTFGVAFTKEIAGLGIICLVGVYYFINLFIDQKHKASKALATIYLLLAASAIIMLIFGSYFNPQALLIINAIFSLLSWSLAFYYHPKQQRFGKLTYIMLFLVSSAFFLVVDSPIVWKILVSMLLACFAWFWVSLLVQNFQFSLGFKKWQQLVRRVLNRQEPVDDLFQFPTLNLLFLIGWLALLLLGWSIVYRPEIAKELNELFSYVGDLQRNFNSAQTFFLGLGNAASIFPPSFFYKVITYQGVLGMIAYLGLAFTVIFVTIRQIFRDHKRKLNFSLAEVFAPAIIFVPVIGLFVNLSTTVVIVWWILFSVVTASGYLTKRDQLQVVSLSIPRVGNRKLGPISLNDLLPYLRVVVAIVLFYLWMVINNNLLQLLSDGII